MTSYLTEAVALLERAQSTHPITPVERALSILRRPNPSHGELMDAARELSGSAVAATLAGKSELRMVYRSAQRKVQLAARYHSTQTAARRARLALQAVH